MTGLGDIKYEMFPDNYRNHDLPDQTFPNTHLIKLLVLLVNNLEPKPSTMYS